MSCPTPAKKVHQTREDAVAHQHRLERKKGANDLNVYCCGDHYHVSHSAIALSKRIRQALRGNR